MLLYHHPCFSLHDTGAHPEQIARITGVNEMLSEKGWLERCQTPSWTPADPTQLGTVHDPVYISKLHQWCEEAAGQIESDTVVSAGSWQAATMAAGAGIDAVKRLVDGEDRRAFVAARPPGHHALPQGAMGFCLTNNIAVAAQAAIAQGLSKVLIVDWDVHHGNGTQDIFYEEGQVGFFSIHRSPFYPGTGAVEETGTGAGLGSILNAPVQASISWKEFQDRFRRGMEDLAQKMKPELVLISAGFDAHPMDPVGGLCVEEPCFAELTKSVMEIADSYCEGKVLSMLEGGYNLEHLPQCVHEHLVALAN